MKNESKSDAEKKGKKQKHFRKSFVLDLPDAGKVKVTMAHTAERVDRPVKYTDGVHFVGGYAIPRLRRLKKNGKDVTATVTVPGCRVKLEYEDGTVVEQRSCCKAPDVFRSAKGFSAAIHRIFAKDSGYSLNKYEEGGKRQQDEVEPRLSGPDRKILFDAVKRKGKKRKEKVIATETPTETAAAG